MCKAIVLAAVLFTATIASASADVVISTDPTQNMSCSAGVCVPTATDAVLNVTDLENLLASGNLSVVTTNGSIQANNIDIAAAFSWSVASSLTLDAYQAITFSAVAQNLSTGNVSLVTNDGGTGGALTFAIGSGKLDTNAVSINGKTYTMASSVKQLAELIVRKPNGHFALSKDTNASKDGVYYTSPIPVAFRGAFNGLGHTISKLEIVDTTDQYVSVALFTAVSEQASIASVMLKNAIVTTSKYSNGAALAGVSYGTVRNCFSSGRITGGYAGGLLVANGGLVTTSQSAALVHAEGDGGGLVGENGGSIVASFATGNVTGRFPYYGVELGGLVGANGGTNAIIENSYSTGAVLGKSKPVTIGGFVGYNYNGSISTSYSIGQVAAKRRKQYVGGFSGGDAGTIASSYWDADTSGTDQGSGDGNETGLTGLTTAQFQSGLPSGFDPSIWAEDSSINNGFPYLIANPPAK